MQLPFPDLKLRSHGGASAALFTLAVFTSALALGGLHTPVLCVVAALFAMSAFVGWFPSTPSRTRLSATIIVAVAVFLIGFTALQALPIPARLVALLSPATAAVWAGTLSPLHEPGPSWTSLSLDPTATRIEVLRGVAYLASFLAALRISERRGGTRLLSLVIAGAALALAASALLHPIFGAERVFGIYKPTQISSERHIAPLLNANHLAAYINIGFCISLGLAIQRDFERHRPIAISVAAVLAATQLWVASRGGALAMCFGAVCVFLTARASQRFNVRTSLQVLISALVVFAGIGMLVLASTPEAVQELSSLDVSKVQIALSALPLALRSPFFGVGRGTFEVAFPAMRHDTWGYNTFSHPENILVQWVTEWGIPVALLGVVALLVALRPSVLLVSSSPAIGAWAAIATTAVHNLVDFNSEVPAIGVATAACAAMVVAGRGNERSGRIHRWSLHPRVVAASVGIATTIGIAVALLGWPHELSHDRAHLYALVTQPTLDDEMSPTVRAALLRHPSEAYIPYIASTDASRRGQSVIPWIERALELAPVYGPAHFVLAEQLERSSPAQARLEYRIAMSQDGQLVGQSLSRAVALVRSYDDALELVPDRKPARLSVLDGIAEGISGRLPGTCERLDEVLRKLDPNARGPLSRAINDSIADLGAHDAAPWCEDRQACARPGLAAAKRLAALQPGTCGPSVSKARLELATDDTSPALRDLQTAAQTVADPSECWRSLGELAFETRSDTYVNFAEDAISRSGCVTDSECASNLAWAANLEERRGNYRRAMGYYERAADKAPDRRDIFERIAQLASALGLHAQALDAYRRLARMSPDADKWRTLADHEKMQVFHEASP